MAKEEFPRVLSVAKAQIYAVSYLDAAGRAQGMPVLVIGDRVLTFQDNQLVTNDPSATPAFIRDAVKETINKEGFESA